MSSWILANLHPALHIDFNSLKTLRSMNQDGPASPEKVLQLKQEFPNTPDDYLDIISEQNFIAVGTVAPHKPYFYMSILSPDDILAWRGWYPFLLESMPDCFFFGTDGDMSFLVGEHQGKKGVHKIQTSAPWWEYAEYLAPTIRALLCDGEGWAEERS